ncbi:MAG: hypothetical protein KC584_15800, partial [Nitrospira sp.]|nr:hypothetical protein [Nitrospira sp.]
WRVLPFKEIRNFQRDKPYGERIAAGSNLLGYAVRLHTVPHAWMGTFESLRNLHCMYVKNNRKGNPGYAIEASL